MSWAETGGLPPTAERRLRELRGDAHGLFTSALSVNEWGLVHREGVEPITQVMGSCVHKIGWQSMPWGTWTMRGQVQELGTISEAWNECRRLALGRLGQEAKLAGADAVVGVRMQMGAHDWLDDAVELVATGTAVREPGTAGAPGLLTDLSGQEYWALARAGVRAVGIVAATSVFYVVASGQTQRAMRGSIFGGGWRNQELADFTQGVYSAREAALARVTAQARALGASGVVGVSIDQQQRVRRVGSESNEREDLIVTFHVAGTAIVEGAATSAPPTLPVLSLSPTRRA